jgi:regulator of protease activity HflC (stomatin/prohibitin superfamily)
MFRTFLVKKDERALLFNKGDFVQVLGPGEHTKFDPLQRLSIENFSLAQAAFTHRLAEYFMNAQTAVVEREFYFIKLASDQVGLRYENGVLVEVLAPNTRRLYWKGYVEVTHKVLNIATDFQIDAALAKQLVESSETGFKAKVTGAAQVFGVKVPQYNLAILFVDGKRTTLLEPGVHAFWRFGRDLQVQFVDLRLQVLEVAGQEILTRDKVALRVNLTAGYRFTNVETAFAQQAKPAEFLYKELQFGLRAAVGTRTLDEILENKTLIDDVVKAYITKRLEGFGLELESVGVKDIILPGDMKTLLAKVVEAEKVAQANVIRRREETAATRSLLNTAMVMEKNPIALRLKELEALEKIAEKIDKISVFGGLDGVLKDLVKIRAD